jgi:NAD(P)-dependent dehydrogenase (short-subunit alcohol dehydrogenase family)
MDIAVIGGTGEEGFGLSLRLGKAGRHVIIGSRSEEKGAGAAEKARELSGGTVDGTTNEKAAETANVIFVTRTPGRRTSTGRSRTTSRPGRSSWTARARSPRPSAGAPGR